VQVRPAAREVKNYMGSVDCVGDATGDEIMERVTSLFEEVLDLDVTTKEIDIGNGESVSVSKADVGKWTRWGTPPARAVPPVERRALRVSESVVCWWCSPEVNTSAALDEWWTVSGVHTSGVHAAWHGVQHRARSTA
jgi:hypothetical protein